MIRNPQSFIKEAATCIFVRNNKALTNDEKLEVFVQTRASTMSFAPNNTVFPGGGKDLYDRNVKDTLIRETLEETGILLMNIPQQLSPQEETELSLKIQNYRKQLNQNNANINTIITTLSNDYKLTMLDSQQLIPMDTWITPFHPEQESRRYRVNYFICEVPYQPNNKQPDSANSESVYSYWEKPQKLINDFNSNHIELVPPTWWFLNHLSNFNNTNEIISHSYHNMNNVKTVQPQWLNVPDNIQEYYKNKSITYM